MIRPRTISSSSSSSICARSGSHNGFTTASCHPQTIMQINESGSKLSEPSPVIEIEVDDDSDKADDTNDGIVDTMALESASTFVRSSTSTIPVGKLSDKIDQATMASKSPKDSYIIIPTNDIKCTENTEGKENKNNKKDIINIDDTIADIAASSHFRSRRKNRERTVNTSTLQQTNVPTSNSMPLISHPPTIVTASMNNHYVPPRLLVDGSNGPQNKVSVHMLNSVGLECGDDGRLRLECFDDDNDTDATICANDVDGVGPIMTENETRRDKTTTLDKEQKPLTWRLEEHRAFAAAIFEIGLKNCSPSIIMENMRKQPRYITRERTKSHLQKYRQTKERSKGDFLKEYNAFFESTEEAKAHLNSKKNADASVADKDKSSGTSINSKHKEPIPKAVLSMALEGKKPSKLLGGKAAALLSYSVLNGLNTSHGPDQLQYKAAKFSEFPSMTEVEKRSSVGASLLQVKSLIDNMTDILLKTRHDIKAFPLYRSGIGDEVSNSSSVCPSDDGYSDDDENNIESGGAVDKNLIRRTGNKDQDAMTAATVNIKRGGPFPIGVVSGMPAHPLYPVAPSVFPAPFPSQVAPPPVATAFPPPQYHVQPSFYGAPAPGFGAPANFHHPQMHYAQDPRIIAYQQAPPVQVGSYPGVPPMQSNYYPAAAGYPAYYGSSSGDQMKPDAGNASAEYIPHHSTSGEVFANPSRHGGDEQHQRPNAYDQRSQSYSNDGRSDRRAYDMNESPTEKESRRRAEKRSKHRRNRDDRVETIDTEFGDFLDRLSEVPSPSKASRQASSSPIQKSRRHGRYKSSQPLHSEASLMDKPTRKRSKQHLQSQQQQYHQQFETDDQSNLYAKNFGSPEVDHFSEGGASRFTSSYEVNSVHRAQVPSERNNNGQFWESSNFGEAGYNNQQQPPDASGGDFHQHPAQIDQNHRSYDCPQSSPEGGSTTNYFFGE